MALGALLVCAHAVGQASAQSQSPSVFDPERYYCAGEPLHISTYEGAASVAVFLRDLKLGVVSLDLQSCPSVFLQGLRMVHSLDDAEARWSSAIGFSRASIGAAAAAVSTEERYAREVDILVQLTLICSALERPTLTCVEEIASSYPSEFTERSEVFCSFSREENSFEKSVETADEFSLPFLCRNENGVKTPSTWLSEVAVWVGENSTRGIGAQNGN